MNDITLPDVMSRLVELDPNICQNCEPEGQEHEYCIFQQLPIVSTVQNWIHTANMTVNAIHTSPANTAIGLMLKIAQD